MVLGIYWLVRKVPADCMYVSHAYANRQTLLIMATVMTHACDVSSDD